jgi:hypothetical protein
MVIGKMIQARVAKPHVALTFECMRYLKVIVIVMTAVQGFMQRVIRHGIQHVIIDPA